MKKNILYLREMAVDAKMTGEIKSHRVRTLENIDIVYNGVAYNLFMEFTVFEHYNYRTTNKRTGAPLKKIVKELVNPSGLSLDSQYEREENGNGYTFTSSYRLSTLEKEIWNQHLDYNKKNILEVVNRYKVGEKFTDVVFVEAEARRIIEKIGGWREKYCLADGVDFQTEGDSYMTIGEWTNSHKIITVHKREWVENPDKKSRRLVDVACCDVDICNKSITG